jgi:hypothetical protein
VLLEDYQGLSISQRAHEGTPRGGRRAARLQGAKARLLKEIRSEEEDEDEEDRHHVHEEEEDDAAVVEAPAWTDAAEGVECAVEGEQHGHDEHGIAAASGESREGKGDGDACEDEQIAARKRALPEMEEGEG